VKGIRRKRSLGLDVDELGQFIADLADVWLERGYNEGVKLGPIDELVKTFTSGNGCLPCIWQANCADEFISIDARGFVAQCDCWVTSYPEYFFGNIYESGSLGRMLAESSARRKFVERPAAIIPSDCIELRLSFYVSLVVAPCGRTPSAGRCLRRTRTARFILRCFARRRRWPRNSHSPGRRILPKD
jgi:hypothetical protein